MDYSYEDVKKTFDEAKKKIGKVNIAVVGKTGVGKSTLINAVFDEDLAETGVGRPITQNCRMYSKEGSHINLLDTKGFELENYASILAQLQGIIQDRKTADAATHIHLAWYCINSTSNRLEDAETRFINELASMIPVIVVVTQSINPNKALIDRISIDAPNVKQIVKVLAKDYEIEGVGSKKAFGLDTLAAVSSQVLPEAFQTAFAAAQKVNFELRVKAARRIIHASSAAAGTACAVPVPLTDAALLIPIQVAMLAGISNAMGLDSSERFLATLVSSAAGTIGATYAGRLVFTNILKLIPGVGSAIGAVVGSSTAVAITELLGNAYIMALMGIIQHNAKLTPENIASAFRSELKKRKIND